MPGPKSESDRERKGATLVRAARKLSGAVKMPPAEQRRRFIEAAREAGASEDEAEFDKALGAIVKAKGG